MQDNKAQLKIAVEAALAGDWHKSHDIAQDYSDPIANWIHAVLHKIEGDVGNSNYWYARTIGANSMAKTYQDYANVEDELRAISNALA